jgi:hypothetical protein
MNGCDPSVDGARLMAGSALCVGPGWAGGAIAPRGAARQAEVR